MRTILNAGKTIRARCDRCAKRINAEAHLSSSDADLFFVGNLPCGHIHGYRHAGGRALHIAWELVKDMSTEEVAVATLMMEEA